MEHDHAEPTPGDAADPASDAPPAAAPAGPTWDDLVARFPGLRPVKHAPSAYTLNGFGLMFYGRGQRDAATGTYERVRWLTALFLPVLAIDAYRVFEDDRILGRVPLRAGHKLWNQLLTLAAITCVVLFAWLEHTGSPAYRAQQQLERATSRLEAGDLAEAASAYAGLHGGPQAGAGREGLGRVLEAAAGADVAASADALLEVGASAYVEDDPAALFTAARCEALVQAAQAGAAQAPREAWRVLETLARFAPQAVEPAREPVLRACLEAAPGDAELVSQLALLLEADEDVDGLLALLRPLAGKLGAHEGARILGQLLLYQGELEPAFAELEPYVQGRLAQLARVSADYERELDAGWKRGLDRLDAGAAGKPWYQAYQQADEAEQGRLVQAWVAKFLETDPSLREASLRYREATGVVPVALDLGILQLQRAQAEDDPNRRKAKLQAAEQVFLAVQDVAGDTATYRLNLGKVKYWLGKGEEGHALFQALLEESAREPEVLLAVARELRDVGDSSSARALVEEAWERAEEPELKYAAAGFRGRFGGEPEELVTWLERADPKNAEVQASLAAARGRAALERSELAEAAGHLREALTRYDELPRSAATLNNAALASYELFLATGEGEALTVHVERLLEAERLAPADPIVKGNVAQALHTRALLRAAGQVDFGALRRPPGDAIVPFLAADREGLARVEAALAGDEDLQAAIARYEQLLIVSPRDPGTYDALLALRWYARDAAQNEALAARVRKADLDVTDRLAEQQAWLAAGPDESDQGNLRRLGARAAEAVERARGANPLTFAFAVSRRVELGESLVGAGLPLDADALVAQAEEAHAAAPSLGTLRARVTAHLLRARQRLGALETFAATEAHRHAYGAAVWVASLMTAGDDAQREALAGDPDVRQAGAWVVELAQGWPERQSPWQWALLRGLELPEAEACAAWLREDTLGAARGAVYRALGPLSVSTAVDDWWRALLAGDAEAAERVLAEARAAGVPFPFTPTE